MRGARASRGTGHEALTFRRVPPVVAVTDGRPRPLVRRESLADIRDRDAGP